jgi:EAL domain-containing protein (putative c-di-GMP-specific phosphodiesterase class I)
MLERLLQFSITRRWAVLLCTAAVAALGVHNYRRLPIDALKMDLSFVRGATTDPDDASLVTAVIAVAHSLKLKVIAQGVET